MSTNSISRRTATRQMSLIILSTPAAFLAACYRRSDDASYDARVQPTNAPLEKLSAEAVAIAPLIDSIALVAVFVGKRLVELPHPAMRILGIVLVVGSEVAITFLDYAKQTQNFRTAISIDESHELQNTRKLTFQRHDGTIEEQPIGKETY